MKVMTFRTVYMNAKVLSSEELAYQSKKCVPYKVLHSEESLSSL